MTMSLTTNQSELNSMIRVGVKNYRKWECHTGHVVCIQMNAYRIISGSRSENFLWSIIYLTRLEAPSRVPLPSIRLIQYRAAHLIEECNMFICSSSWRKVGGGV